MPEFCYECGAATEHDRYFCDSECRSRYIIRYGSQNISRALGRQTKMRNKITKALQEKGWEGVISMGAKAKVKKPKKKPVKPKKTA